MNHKPVLPPHQTKEQLIVEPREQNGTLIVPPLTYCPKPNGIHPQDLIECSEVNVRRQARHDLLAFRPCYVGCATSKEARMEQGKDKCGTTDIWIGTKVLME